MSELLTIPGLDAATLELLEAAGFQNFKDLAEADGKALVRELERANGILKLCGSVPEQGKVAAWVAHARQQTGVLGEDQGVRMVNHEKDHKVRAMIRSSPLAIPLPQSAIKAKNLSSADIPSGLLLTEYPGALDVRADKKIPKARGGSEEHISHVHVMDQSYQSRLDIDVSRLKTMREAGEKRMRMHASPGASGGVGGNPRVDLIRAPRASTNDGRDPSSRRYIRGVLHPYPRVLYIGSILTLVMMVLTPLAVVSAFLLLLSREMPGSFDWVDSWWLAFPAALPVFALAWLFWGFSGKCRICNQKLFIHRPHRKNAKAHYHFLLGYVIPLCAHMLVFHWFRCSHCGTPVRLKK